MPEQPHAGGRALRTRWAELMVALLLVAIGAVVIIDSLRVGVSWGDDGPKAGYFPHFVGWILAIAGAWIVFQTLRNWRGRAQEVFVTFARLQPVLTVLIPTIAYVALIAGVGIYVASAVYITAFMIWQGKFAVWKALLVGIAVPVAVFLLFEVWFLVPLPKGPLEHLLGY